MRKPKSPPKVTEIRDEFQSHEKVLQLLSLLLQEPSGGPLVNGKYLHWDELVHRPLPTGVSYKAWWYSLKLARKSLYREIPLHDTEYKTFRFALTDPILETLLEIDQGLGGVIQLPEQITNPDTRDRYYVESAMEEAITSSQIEGAMTTRKDARDMLLSGRAPQDKGEKMILNNYRTMQRIREFKNEPLSKDLVFEIHRTITEGTMESETDAGRFRTSDEHVYVADDNADIYFFPPPAEQLEERMDRLCSFANGDTPEGFLHPVVRSIILHFWLAYDHPFVDGNGRTARALFYWSMVKRGYWLFEYLSISQIILRSRTAYSRAFLYTESDENDLTYFVLHQMNVIHEAMEALHEFIRRTAQETRSVDKLIRGSVSLNQRQRVLIGHAIRHPSSRYTFEEHSHYHGVSYETGRADLTDLQRRGLLDLEKIGRRKYFKPVADFEQQLANVK